METARSTTRVRAGAIVVMFATALFATACGGDETAAPAASPSATDKRAAYRECLRKNGAELPGPGQRDEASAAPDQKGRAGSPELRKARKACRSLAPHGAQNPAKAAARKAFRACLEEHGVTLPRKKEDGAEKTDDPKVAEALKECRPLRNSPQPSPSPKSSS